MRAKVGYEAGWYRDPDGRLKVYLRGTGYRLFSRCVMEGHLRRTLAYEEVVHHINGDVTDDRLENLQIVSRVEHFELHREYIIERRRQLTSKLTPEQVAEIKASTEPPAVLAAKFGVTGGAISYHRGPMNPRYGTHCINGHPFDEENTYVSPRGVRNCRRCLADRRAARAQTREAFGRAA